MSKVDLPHFIVSASSDITRWRYDASAHVSAVNGDCTVLSHEQGSGPKNASSVMELIILDHTLRCRGEGIKVVVSDNASVGKNWLTTVALPQYFVDQGLADVVLIVFLENSHGEWFSDMLFGQLQTRQRRTTILGIDGLLKEFESINRKCSQINGFALNPLGCVDFAQVLSNIGYETSPSKDFDFVKRNIHFAAACSPGAKHHLPVTVQQLIGQMLPDERGMVRICRDAPKNCPQSALPYECRHFDVRAARHATLDSGDVNGMDTLADPARIALERAPLVVPIGWEYAANGPGVLSHRNTEHVGYNGIRFWKLNACGELHNRDDPLVREAWPVRLLSSAQPESLEEPVPGSEHTKSAPENWILRRPVARINAQGGEIKSRYPPRNMLTAKHKRPQRSEADFVPTATSSEPPVTLMPKTSAYTALESLQESHLSLTTA